MKLKLLPIVAAISLLLSDFLAAQNRSGNNTHGGMRSAVSSNLVVKPQKGFVTGTVLLSSEEKGKPETPGVGVVVQVISSLKDKKYTTADSLGRFRIFGVNPGNAIVSFSMMGYESQERVVTIVPGMNRMIANLKPVSYELKAAVKKETVSPVTVVKDTVIFHASAVKVNPGEMAIDILEQMPGVEVTDSGIKVLGEQVENVYVDGALLFGNAPMAALKNLDAEEVVTIKSYQEYANKDPYHKISKNEQKQRVLDITTKNRPKFVRNIDAIAGGGFDTDSTYHKFRYTLGATANFFSEKLVIKSTVNVNNINDSSNNRRGNSFRTASAGGSVDLRDISANLDVRKKWMSPNVRNFVIGMVGGGYSFSDKYDVSESATQKIYFPSDQFDSRETYSSSYKFSTDKTHDFDLEGMRALRDGKIRLEGSFSIVQNLAENVSSSSNIQNGGSPKGSYSSKNSDNHEKNYSASLNFNKGFNNKVRLRFTTTFKGSDNSKGTARVDTVISSITKTYLDIEGQGTSRQWVVNPSVRWEINDNASLSAGYRFNDVDKTETQIAVNTGSGEIDEVNSHTFSTSNRTNIGSVSFDNHFERLGGAILRLEGSYASRTLKRDETYPQTDWYDHPFNFFLGSASLGTESIINRWRVSYSTDCNTPALDQVRPRINNSNLYSVSAGNPDLKMSRSHSASFSYSTVLGVTEEDVEEALSEHRPHKGRGNNNKKNQDRKPNLDRFSTLDLSASFNAVTDPIVSRQIYFTEDTYLPKYGYTMPAQSTFNTYGNATPSYSASLSGNFAMPLEKLRCLFHTGFSMNWDQIPSYVNYSMVRTSSFNPSAHIRLRTNFSKNIRLNLRLNGSYVYSANDLGDFTDYWVERINFGFEFNNIFRHIYIGGNYMKSFTQGLEYGRLNDNILNAGIGVKFGPRNRYDLSLNAHDIFDTTTGFSTSLNDNFITNSWKHRFGRNVMLTFTCRFNKGGKGKR